MAAMVLTMTDEPNTVCTHSGDAARESGTIEMPTPSATEIPTMLMTRGVKFSLEMSLMPVMVMDANTESVASKGVCRYICRRGSSPA